MAYKTEIIPAHMDDDGNAVPEMEHILHEHATPKANRAINTRQLEIDHPQFANNSVGSSAESDFDAAVRRGQERARKLLETGDTDGANWHSVDIQANSEPKPMTGRPTASRSRLSNRGKLIADREPDRENDPAYQEAVMPTDTREQRLAGMAILKAARDEERGRIAQDRARAEREQAEQDYRDQTGQA